MTKQEGWVGLMSEKKKKFFSKKKIIAGVVIVVLAVGGFQLLRGGGESGMPVNVATVAKQDLRDSIILKAPLAVTS